MHQAVDRLTNMRHHQECRDQLMCMRAGVDSHCIADRVICPPTTTYGLLQEALSAQPAPSCTTCKPHSSGVLVPGDKGCLKTILHGTHTWQYVAVM